MTDTDPLTRSWHPVARSQDLSPDAATPHRTRLFGRGLVAFRGSDGTPAVLDARCVHRGTDLAHGAVHDGCVVCPYHGWEFAADGTCVRIPSLADGQPVPPGARQPRLAAAERGGLVWASLDPDADPGAIPALPDAPPGLRAVVGDPMVWRTSAGRHLENILDLAHFPFVHPGTFGCKEAEAVEAHEVEITPGAIACDVGVLTQNPETPHGRLYPGLGPLIRLGYRYEVTLPYRITLRFAFPDGMRRELHEVICPTAPDTCTIYWLLFVDERLDSDDADELAFAHQVFAEDQPVIESQPPGVPLDRRAEVHVPGDRLAVAYRRALREWGCPEETLV
jgi:vanillate O-demethylase monooxygenase subunit